MAKFRKRPVVIEAEQFTPHHNPEGICFEHHEGCSSAHVHTLEGVHLATIGDWIITGVKGERYPCKPDIFDLTYEPGTG